MWRPPMRASWPLDGPAVEMPFMKSNRHQEKELQTCLKALHSSTLTNQRLRKQTSKALRILHLKKRKLKASAANYQMLTSVGLKMAMRCQLLQTT
ncbi:hypothetical protein WMY93_029738 [Mugilogobius chulae]|uniref:Uncharacterized protein n=1 Tax=Mugilogobius chulae TaxID=88201 RepID=A0AAW0MWM0_9GOBI